MLKGKLLAIISGSMSVVVAATTALTLGISGPRNTMSLNALSENDAIAHGVSNIFDSAATGVDTVTQVIDTISDNKAALSVGFNINEIKGIEELSGLGANLDVNFDTENGQYSLDANAVYGTIELFNTILYLDEKDLVVSMPTFFNGIIKVSYDNIAEDMKNSYVGSLLEEEGFDFEEYRDELMAALDDAANAYAEFKPEFDYEDFYEGLGDVMNDAYLEAFKNMDVKNNGMQALTGGEYHCYTASLSVADLSYIVRDVVLYMLESEELQDYIDYVMEYMSEMQGSNMNDDLYDDDLYEDIYGDYDDDYDYNDIIGGSTSGMDISYGEQLGSMAPMVETYWPGIVKEVEAVLGKNIEFTIYLTDTVETAGFEFYASLNSDGSFNYKKAAVTGAEAAIVLKGDFTGGKEIGDYSFLSFEALEFGQSVMLGEYSLKMEENGDFAIDLSAKEEGEEVGVIKLDGKYTENDVFFSLKIDSIKYIEDGKTLFDIGLHVSFEPINGVIKPSGSPEHDIWDMNEEQLNALVDEINENIEKLEDTLSGSFN